MNKDKKETGSKLLFEVDKNIEGGYYCNMANVVHNKNEFLIDFAITLPGKKAAKVQSRIITSPIHAKQLLSALQHNIATYEQNFGEIEAEDMQPRIKNTKTIH